VEVDGISLGMVVDHVDRVVSVDSKRIESLSPIFNGPAMLCFPGVLKYDDRLFLLLNPAGIVSVKRDQWEFSETGATAPDRKQHPAAPRHPVSGDDRQPQMPYSEYRSPRIKAQPSAIDIDNKVQSNA
jgi:hypothetical protein